MRSLTSGPIAAATSPPARRVPIPKLLVVSLGLAVVSLVLPVAIGYDPWAWLVWGREVGRLDLDTTGSPSWKPLPVLFTTALAPFGGAAPLLWVVLSRVAGLLSVAFTYRLAARYAGAAAGVVAVGVLVLAPDPDPRFIRLLVEGHTGLPAATLVLWAVERHLDGRHAHALVLGTALALLRPEAWPFLGLYSLWLWWREPSHRPAIAVALATIPVLWFGADWWGSGDPSHGADAAQVVFAETTDRSELALRRFGQAVVAPAWVAAAVAVATAARRGERTLVVLGAAAVSWMALVVAMTMVARYAALSRFFLPGAALLCVLAGIGAVRTVAAVVPGGPRLAAASLALAASVPFVMPRAMGLADVAEGVEARARLEEDLDHVLAAAGGPDAVLACGSVSVDGWGGQRPALAWKLDVHLSDVDNGALEGPGVVFARADGRRDTQLSDGGSSAATEIARRGHWAVHAVDCPAAVPIASH